jgi:hypothetical protein
MLPRESEFPVVQGIEPSGNWPGKRILGEDICLRCSATRCDRLIVGVGLTLAFNPRSDLSTERLLQK